MQLNQSETQGSHSGDCFFLGHGITWSGSPSHCTKTQGSQTGDCFLLGHGVTRSGSPLCCRKKNLHNSNLFLAGMNAP